MTLGIDLSTDVIGICFYDGVEVVSAMEFTDRKEAIEFIRRRINEQEDLSDLVMQEYNRWWIKRLIGIVSSIKYEPVFHLPYNATRRATYLAKNKQSKRA